MYTFFIGKKILLVKKLSIWKNVNENNNNNNNNNNKIFSISVKNAASGLKIFINYFEQQNDSEFNINNLQIFKNIYKLLEFRNLIWKGKILLIYSLKNNWLLLSLIYILKV